MGIPRLCARITAKTPEEALRLLRTALPDDEVSLPTVSHGDGDYINVYINYAAISTDDIDDATDVEAPG